MSAVEELEEREDEPHTGWVPRVITGGKGPPQPPVIDYLSTMEPLTVFLSSGKVQTDAHLFKLIWKGTKFSLLELTLNDATFERYVQTMEFCKTFPVYEILNTNPQQEGDYDEPECNRTD